MLVESLSFYHDIISSMIVDDERIREKCVSAGWLQLQDDGPSPHFAIVAQGRHRVV